MSGKGLGEGHDREKRARKGFFPAGMDFMVSPETLMVIPSGLWTCSLSLLPPSKVEHTEGALTNKRYKLSEFLGLFSVSFRFLWNRSICKWALACVIR